MVSKLAPLHLVVGSYRAKQRVEKKNGKKNAFATFYYDDFPGSSRSKEMQKKDQTYIQRLATAGSYVGTIPELKDIELSFIYSDTIQ